MELPQLLQELIAAAQKVGITVRAEPFDPTLSDARNWRGGLCVLRGQRVILIDKRAPLPDRIAMVAGALAAIDLEHIYMPPIVRATIGAYQGESPSTRVPCTEPLPPVRARHRKEGE